MWLNICDKLYQEESKRPKANKLMNICGFVFVPRGNTTAIDMCVRETRIPS